MDDDARRGGAPGRVSGVPGARPLESGSLMAFAVAQATVGLIVTDPDGVVLDLNETASRMIGRSAEAARGMTLPELSHPDDAFVSTGAIAEVRAGLRDTYEVRRRWLRPDGTVVPAHITVAGVRGPDGSLQMLLGQSVDLSALERAEQEARDSSAVLRGVVDTLMDPWVLMAAVRDDAGQITDFEYRDANEAACRANRTPRDELIGSRFLALLPGHLATGLFKQYVEVVETGMPLAHDEYPWSSELTDGRTRYFDNRAVKVGDGLSFTWRDVTARAEQRHRLSVQALRDPLTGLANRQALLDAMEEMCARAPDDGACAAVLYCDLDGLKGVNDGHGHEAGDRVLRAVADRMTAAVRASDVVARLGGDEFVVLAEGVRDHDQAVQLALKVADAVSRPVELTGGRAVVPTLSIGVSLGRPGLDPLDVLRDADQAMFRDKRDRRDAGDQNPPATEADEPDDAAPEDDGADDQP